MVGPGNFTIRKSVARALNEMPTELNDGLGPERYTSIIDDLLVTSKQ